MSFHRLVNENLIHAKRCEILEMVRTREKERKSLFGSKAPESFPYVHKLESWLSFETRVKTRTKTKRKKDRYEPSGWRLELPFKIL